MTRFCDALRQNEVVVTADLPLRADILGAAALDITSLLIMRGEKLTQDDGTQSDGVFDTGETRLLSRCQVPADTALPERKSAAQVRWQARRVANHASGGPT